MQDLEIVKFYNSVKDPSWPDIQSYFDFARLPLHIKKECNNIHGFQQKKSDILNRNWWCNVTTYVCVYKDLAYVPIPKCAHTHYVTMLTNIGWKMVPLSQVNIESTKFVGLMMHPWSRWLKGLTQWVASSYSMPGTPARQMNPWSVPPTETNWPALKLVLRTPEFKRLISTISIGDAHTMPYSIAYSKLINKVNWIPMDIMSDSDITRNLSAFCKLHGHDVQLPDVVSRINASSGDKIELYNTISQLYSNSQLQQYSFYKVFNEDLDFFYNLLDNFDTVNHFSNSLPNSLSK